MIVEEMTITSQQEIAPKIYQVTLRGESAKSMTNPGQFVHIRVEKGMDPTLRRPLSICDVNVEKGELTIVYRIEGKGTKLIAGKQAGEKLDILGPLGKGFPVEAAKQGDVCVLVGGGVGIPPLYYLAKQLVAKGAKVITIIGFRKAGDVFLEEEFKQFGEVIITTEDGSKGIKGFVTDALQELSEYQLYYSCGPKPMLRAIEREATSPGFISLEERMGCGIGACLACVCDVKDPEPNSKSYRKICSDGPVFSAGEVVI